MMLTLVSAIVAVALQTSEPLPQGVEYRIEARLEEETSVLRGRGELRYTNNAPVPIDTLWFHQHLNAFRPNSAWARRELELGERRFQDLGADDHAFERFRAAVVDGVPVSPTYPLAPDSTVAGFALPRPLGTGETITVRFDWEARPSTTPRRQGRAGRHYDFAQWYPRIAVHDSAGWQVQPLLPQGEFFGEFATYDVVLDVAEDQVIGATGVPVEGDPGWAGRSANGGAIDYQRDFYGDPPATALGLLPEVVEPARKRVRWYAKNVHHFAWSANPEFVYEGGSVPRGDSEGGAIPIHVLYWPGDVDWANGAVVRRTEVALGWLQEMFGPYPWPQLTNLHRIEPGGTEFPMMMMNGSPSEGLIVHEATHQYLHGILANNEFAEGWLDEGFTSFLTNWYLEERGVANPWEGAIEGVRQAERLGVAQPIAIPGADFRDPNRYGLMTYSKADLVFRMLRWMIGEEGMRTVLRTLYERRALSHIGEQDLRAAVEDVTGADYDWFFDQWLHTTHQLDYAIGSAWTEQADGGWRTTVEVRRLGEAWMPVTLMIGGVERRLEGRERVQTVVVQTEAMPTEIVLDPEMVLIEPDRTNNRARPVVR